MNSGGLRLQEGQNCEQIRFVCNFDFYGCLYWVDYWSNSSWYCMSLLMKVSELNPPELDYWVAKACGYTPEEEWKHSEEGTWIKENLFDDGARFDGPNSFSATLFNPSTNWCQGGPIIEREQIDIYTGVSEKGGYATVHVGSGRAYFGANPLIAAMRAYVASKFGEEVTGGPEL